MMAATMLFLRMESHRIVKIHDATRSEKIYMLDAICEHTVLSVKYNSS
jgi:hypothetical protein